MVARHCTRHGSRANLEVAFILITMRWAFHYHKEMSVNICKMTRLLTILVVYYVTWECQSANLCKSTACVFLRIK